MHAAYVLLLVLHTCRLHIRAAYEYMRAACVQHTNACNIRMHATYECMHVACEQEGTNWSCMHQDFLHMCSTHLLVCEYVSLECSTLKFSQKM